MSWYSGLNARILLDEPLAKHTTLRLGPPAKVWIEPYARESLRAILSYAKAKERDYLVIGCGSKLLITKRKVPLAIHLGSPQFMACSVNEADITAGSGLKLSVLANTAYTHSLGGLEFLSGIPATVGGALMLNAGIGWPERIEIGSFVDEVEVMDKNGRIKILPQKSLSFGYRLSSLRPYVILSARFKLFRKRKENIKLKTEKFLEYRKKTQELGSFSAGCIFKNVNGYSSGRLIASCGLKGRQVGDAVISRKHANFIINRGNATAKDIVSLMKIMKAEVKRRFKLNLEPEIQII